MEENENPIERKNIFGTGTYKVNKDIIEEKKHTNQKDTYKGYRNRSQNKQHTSGLAIMS